MRGFSVFDCAIGGAFVRGAAAGVLLAAAAPGGLGGGCALVSNEHGLITELNVKSGELQPLVERPGARWDNHLAIVLLAA